MVEQDDKQTAAASSGIEGVLKWNVAISKQTKLFYLSLTYYVPNSGKLSNYTDKSDAEHHKRLRNVSTDVDSD